MLSTADGCHLWAQSFDREMENPFDLQAQLAHAIAASLRVRLLDDGPVRRPTRDVETYNAFLRGRFFRNQRTPEGLREALRCFDEAVTRDPGFAAAHAGIADCYSFLLIYGTFSREETLPRAEAAVSRALELVYLAQAYVQTGAYENALAAAASAEPALRAFVRARAADGSEARQLLEAEEAARPEFTWQGILYLGLGQEEGAIAPLKRALERFEPAFPALYPCLRPLFHDPRRISELDLFPPRG